MGKGIGKLAAITLICMVILGTMAIPASEANISNISVTPGQATANSTWTFSFVWQDDEGALPDEGSIVLLIDGSAERMTVPDYVYDPVNDVLISLHDGQPALYGRTYRFQVSAGLQLPRMPQSPPYVIPAGIPEMLTSGGNEYWISLGPLEFDIESESLLATGLVSGGYEIWVDDEAVAPYDMVYIEGESDDPEEIRVFFKYAQMEGVMVPDEEGIPVLTNPIIANYGGPRPVHERDPALLYWPALRANGDGSPRTVSFGVAGVVTPLPPTDPEEEPEDPDRRTATGGSATIHDSHPGLQGRWGGRHSGKDALNYYTGNWYHDVYNIRFDPLSTLPPGFNPDLWDDYSQFVTPDDEFNPDDGSRSTTFTFRVHYTNADNLPPTQYLPGWQFGLPGFSSTRGRDYSPPPGDPGSGVVLYMRQQAEGDEEPDEWTPLGMWKEWPQGSNYAGGVTYIYRFYPGSLPNGRYEYFFGCSDDIIRTLNPDVPIPGWTSLAARSNPLDPDEPLDIPLSDTDAALPRNPLSYVDRFTRQPGMMDNYAFQASDHPEVSLGLLAPNNSHIWLYLSPIPNSSNQGTISPVSAMIDPSSGASTAGAVSSGSLHFQIEYTQIDGIAPEDTGGEISLWLNPNTANEQRVTLQRVNSVLGSDIREGVLYRTPTPLTLPPGQHTYRFVASDGQRKTEFPVYGMYRHRVESDGLYFSSRSAQSLYVNNRPTLSNFRVEPSWTGTAGDNFRFIVRYRDLDNQPPHRAYMDIRYGNNPDQYERVVMTRLDPSNSNFAAGVDYHFDSANLANRLEPGTREVRFEFMDDWGRRQDPNSRMPGETVFLPAEGAWMAGPVILSNRKPTLTNGRVESHDGTSNPGTLWSYMVRYRDLDNHAPAFMNVFIGKAEKDEEGNVVDIVWDYGHPMEEADPSDRLYSDGKDYVYSTRLPSDQPGDTFYYAFVASDGIDMAVYHPDSSASAHAIWDPTELIAPSNEEKSEFYTTHAPLVGEVPLTPINPVYRYPLASQVLVESAIIGEIRLSDEEDPNSNYEIVVPGAGWEEDAFPGMIVRILTGSAGGNTYQISANTSDTIILNTNRLSRDGVAVGHDFRVSRSLFYGGTYEVDYLSGLITLMESFWGDFDGTADLIEMQYWFGSEGPIVANANTPPSLESGTVTPSVGETTDTFNFSVVYKDPDGPWGQMPLFVRVIVDGRPYPMTPVFGGSLNYRTGVRYQVGLNLSSGSHQYYFEASDGSAYAVYDLNGWRASNDIIDDFTPIPGPFVNDRPVLSNGQIFPRGIISIAQPVTYTVIYTDNDNEAPNPGYPVVYIDNPTEENWGGTVTAVTGAVITDSSQNWTRDQFIGIPLQITSGAAAGNIYRIAGNTATTINLVAADLTADLVRVDDTFQIGRVNMIKSDPSDSTYTDGVTYETLVPSLGQGEHSAHFKSITTETVGPNTRDSVARFPVSGQITGPTVANIAPPGNRAPVLSDPSVDPTTGRTSDTFTFRVTYADPDGDAPTFREGVLGYVRLVINNYERVYDMTPPAFPDYETGAVMTYQLSDLPGGTHRYHFEASDGYFVTRLPARTTQYYTMNVNRRPILSEAKVTPEKGNEGRPFVYSVKYTDLDDNPPASIKLWIDEDGEEPREIEIRNFAIMPPGGPDYTQGVLYSYTLPAGSLSIGEHDFYFTASDGFEDAIPTSKIAKPTIHENQSPSLRSGTVSPGTGWDTDTYTYSVIYSDPNGDEPEYVKVYIDGSTEAHAHVMSKASGSSDFELGVTYTFAKEGLQAGSHTYYFVASDWMETARDPQSGVYTGPTTTARPTATLTVQCSADPRVDRAVTISGTISPTMAVPLTIRFTRPNGSTFQRSVTSAANGTYSYSWTPEMIGTWKIVTTWAGGGSYLPSSSPELTVVVGGPTRVVSGLDMIALPLHPSNTFAEGCFGRTPPFALAKWLPSREDYKMYSLLPGYRTDYDFPLIAAGQAYWIKTNEAKLIAPSGTTVNTNTSFSIPLGVGWNQIGTPFLQQTNWSNLRIRYNQQIVSLATAHANGWVREYGWRYDPSTGNYKLVDATRRDPRGGNAERVMQPWLGYWVRALVSCDLIIPSPTGGDGPPTSPFGIESTESLAVRTTSQPVSTKWEVQLLAANDELRGGGILGLSASKAERIESPACLENYVDLYFTDENNGVYATDLRSALEPGDEWLVRVVTDNPGTVDLTWAGMETVPLNVKLTLVDEETGTRVEMTPHGSYQFDADDDFTNRLFRVIFERR